MRHRLQVAANTRVLSAIDLGTDPKAPKIADALVDAIRRSGERIKKLLDQDLSPTELGRLETQYRREAQSALRDGSWRRDFRGRDILRRFAGQYGSVTYEVFRDLIVSRMRDGGHQPAGMKAVLDEILSDR